MPIEILMPALSPTMKEGNLAKWVKKEGDKIKAGEVIAEIETDKATMEVEAVDEGVLGKIMVAEGTENVPVNSLIALLLEEGEDKKALDGYAVKSAPAASAQAAAKDQSKEENAKVQTAAQNVSVPAVASQSAMQASAQATQAAQNFGGDVKASPLAKRIAKDGNVSLGQIQGSGPHGRVLKDDVVSFMNSGGSARSGAVVRNSQEFYAVKNSNIRKVIARRLLESKQTVPHFYLSCELRMDKLTELRQVLNSTLPEGAPKVSVNDLIIKASALSLKKVPEANSSWTDESVLIYNNVDIAVAVAIDGGLITPIVKNADQKSIFAISSEMKQLVKKAKEGKLQPEEFQGGSFSISNLGMFGIDNFSAIVNPPQSCILAVSRTVEKPVVDHGQIKIGHVMNITLSSDHRSVDGAVGAEFLKAFRNYIENPILMLI